MWLENLLIGGAVPHLKAMGWFVIKNGLLRAIPGSCPPAGLPAGCPAARPGCSPASRPLAPQWGRRRQAIDGRGGAGRYTENLRDRQTPHPARHRPPGHRTAATRRHHRDRAEDVTYRGPDRARFRRQPAEQNAGIYLGSRRSPRRVENCELTLQPVRPLDRKADHQVRLLGNKPLPASATTAFGAARQRHPALQHPGGRSSATTSVSSAMRSTSMSRTTPRFGANKLASQPLRHALHDSVPQPVGRQTTSITIAVAWR